MEEVKKLLDENDYVISPDSYDDSRVIVLKDSLEFLKWFNENKKDLKGRKIVFYSKVFSKDFEKIKVMYDFLNYYLKVKGSYEKRMNEYNDSLVLDSDNRFICEALDLFRTSNSGGKFFTVNKGNWGKDNAHSENFYSSLYEWCSYSIAAFLFSIRTFVLFRHLLYDMLFQKKEVKTQAPLKLTAEPVF